MRRRPIRTRVAGDVLDFVKRIVDVGLEVGPGLTNSPWRLYRHRRQGPLGLHIFGPFEEFEEAHAVGGAVAPAAGMPGRVASRRATASTETRRDLVAFQIIAAGTAEEAGLHVGHGLHQVDPVAVGRSL